MDGTLAVLFIIAGLGDMYANDCPTDCFAQSAAQESVNLKGAALIYQERELGRELFVTYDADRAFGPFQPTAGASITSEGDLWFGFGAKWTSQGIMDGPFFIEASLLPGLYVEDDGVDIGRSLQFRSALGAGYVFDNGDALTVLFDHRSNADTQNRNPGLETFGVRYSFAIDR